MRRSRPFYGRAATLRWLDGCVVGPRAGEHGGLMKISLSFVSIVALAAAGALIGCNAPTAEPEPAQPEATTQGEDFTPKETIIGELAATANDSAKVIDHQWDDKVVP